MSSNAKTELLWWINNVETAYNVMHQTQPGITLASDASYIGWGCACGETQSGGQWLPEVLFVGCLTSQQHASVSQERIFSDNFTCCHTEIEVANQTFYLTQSQYTDTGSTSPSADPVTPGAWQDSHWTAIFLSHWYARLRKNPGASEIRTRDLQLSRRTPYH